MLRHLEGLRPPHTSLIRCGAGDHDPCAKIVTDNSRMDPLMCSVLELDEAGLVESMVGDRFDATVVVCVADMDDLPASMCDAVDSVIVMGKSEWFSQHGSKEVRAKLQTLHYGTTLEWVGLPFHPPFPNKAPLMVCSR